MFHNIFAITSNHVLRIGMAYFLREIYQQPFSHLLGFATYVKDIVTFLLLML